MDKNQMIDNRVKHRQGFALLLTLSVLSVVIALTMVLLSYFDEVHQDASDTKALIQADVYYADISSIFQRFKNKKALFSVLYRSPLPLRTPDGRFSLMLRCKPLSAGVNINWLGGKNSGVKNTEGREELAQELFDELAQEYDIEDAGRLQELIFQEIGTKNRLNTKEQSRLHQKNGIISYQQFEGLVSRYQFEVDDPKIGAVPWQKYFSFSLRTDKIDAEYSSPELISYLFDIDLASVREWVADIEKVSLANFVQNNGGDYAQRKALLADKVFLDETECFVHYGSSGTQYSFRFEYMQGEAKHFEFYGHR